MAPVAQVEILTSLWHEKIKRDVMAMGPTAAHREIFNVISLISMLVIMCLMTIRCRQFYSLKIINASRVVSVCFYATSLASAFVFNHVYLGVGLTSAGNTCKTSIIICIATYVISKYFLYVFMQERVHTIQAPEYTRLQDKPYVFSMTIVSIGCPSVLAYALYSSRAQLTKDDTCRIGLPSSAAGALLAWDIAINTWLLILFISLLLPTLRARAELQAPSTVSSFTRHLVRVKAPTPPSSPPPPASPVELELADLSLDSPTPVVTSLERLIKKSLLGQFLLCTPTAVNLIMFIVMHGLESGFECFLTCTLDITATTIVFHWLTMTPQETASEPPGAS